MNTKRLLIASAIINVLLIWGWIHQSNTIGDLQMQVGEDGLSASIKADNTIKLQTCLNEAKTEYETNLQGLCDSERTMNPNVDCSEVGSWQGGGIQLTEVRNTEREDCAKLYPTH